MEYRALVVGQQTSFAAHVTALATFKPVISGVLTLVLRYADGAELTSQADGPLSPGIFRPLLTPQRAGACRFFLSIASPQVTEQFEVGPCEVYPELRAASASPEEKPGAGRVPFLKEQQWNTDFATAPAAEQMLQPTFAAYGELKPVAGKLHRVVASISGWLAPIDPQPLPGAQVAAGQLLAVIIPRLSADGDRVGLATTVEAARAELEAAEARLKRREDLVANGASSKQEVEEDRAGAGRARARMEAATARLRQYQSGTLGAGSSGGGFQLRTPIAGTLTVVNVQSGEFVEQGQHVLSILNQDQLWLEAHVFESDIPRVQKTRDAWFTIADVERPITIAERQGKLLYVGRALDLSSRTIPVAFEVSNTDGTLSSGQRARVYLHTGPSVRALAVPDSAILEDAGRSIAYVQLEGEAFERRVLELGIRDRGWAEVRAGVRAGERVVTRGAYEIKLASASGSVPAHGHAH